MYEFFSIASGIALLALAMFDASARVNQRLWFVVGGVGFIAYGIYVSNQTSGTYFFPVWIFIIPFLVAGYAIYGVVSRVNSRTDPLQADAPGAKPTSTPGIGIASQTSGEAQSQQRFCGECGAAWDHGARFCHSCGTPAASAGQAEQA